jgi:hypothetical protein
MRALPRQLFTFSSMLIVLIKIASQCGLFQLVYTIGLQLM